MKIEEEDGGGKDGDLLSSPPVIMDPERSYLFEVPGTIGTIDTLMTAFQNTEKWGERGVSLSLKKVNELLS